MVPKKTDISRNINDSLQIINYFCDPSIIKQTSVTITMTAGTVTRELPVIVVTANMLCHIKQHYEECYDMYCGEIF